MPTRRCLGMAAALLLLGCESAVQREASAAAREGIELARGGKTAEAMERFERALALDPNHVASRFNLGLAYLGVEQWAEAARHFERFVELRPDDARGHFELARARALSGLVHPALSSLGRAVELGFDDYALLVADGVFSALYRMPQYVALEMTVAQRAGVEARGGVLGAPGGMQLGSGSETLPGVRLPALERPCLPDPTGDETCLTPPR